MVPVELQRLASQPVVAPQRLDAGAGRRNQVVDDRPRNGVAVQGRVERGLVAARAGVEPVALADAVVQRRVGVEVVLIGPVVRQEGRAPVVLVVVHGHDRAVLAVGHRHRLAGAERDVRELRVGGRERQVGLARRARQARREREQPFAVLVEDVLLLPEDLRDGKPVERQVGGRVSQPATVSNGIAQELRAEPGRGLLPPREQRLDLLPPAHSPRCRAGPRRT